MQIDWASGLVTAGIYLGIPLIIGIFYAQWKWAKTCDENIRVLVAERNGGGRFFFAPKSGGDVTIVNNDTGVARTWPINELATIGLPYPGLGFMPRFLQKEIRVAILNEGDWEPILNRSPHRNKVASPDVIEYLTEIGIRFPKIKGEIEIFLDDVSTSPTREMIADPAILGALKQNTIMQALAQVSDELVDTIKGLRTQLSRVAGLNPTIIYGGLILSIGIGIAIIVMMKNIGITADTVAKIDALYRASGITP